MSPTSWANAIQLLFPAAEYFDPVAQAVGLRIGRRNRLPHLPEYVTELPNGVLNNVSKMSR
jgi:hypothetical protein